MILQVLSNNNLKTILVDHAKSLLQSLQDNNIYIDAPCNSAGKCGKCKAIVVGPQNQLTTVEREFLSEQEISLNTRLACMCVPLGDCNVTVSGVDIGVQTEGELSPFRISPRVTVENAIGIAIDIGTTTVACYFYLLNTATMIYSTSGLNPQRSFGADVISRINASETNSAVLKQLIVDLINSFIAEFCSKTMIDKSHIADICIAGNTVMLHLLTGLNAVPIATAPFRVSSLFGYHIDSCTLGLSEIDAEVYLSDCISSYVGGDISLGLLANNLHCCKEKCLYIDIGTNGEMAIGNMDGFVCCATAAGPAFEGAQIKFGTGAISGAINEVAILNGEIKVSTINNAPAIGICGSGLISAISSMLLLGAIDETGRLDDDADQFFVDSQGENSFMLTNGVYITQKDIREVQLAKSAIAAGISTLMSIKGYNFSDIGKVLLAGGFGSFIDKRAACKISLLPIELIDKIEVVGNAAGMGAVRLLLDKTAISTLKSIVSNCKYYELSGDKFFGEEYINKMMF